MTNIEYERKKLSPDADCPKLFSWFQHSRTITYEEQNIPTN